MVRWIKEIAALLSIGCVVGYAGILAFSPVGAYAPWRASPLELSLVSLLCGLLLGMVSRRAPLLMIIASCLSVGIFGGIWSYITWTQVGRFFSLPELLIADAVFLFVLQRGSILFTISALFGLLGASAGLMLVPRHEPT